LLSGSGLRAISSSTGPVCPSLEPLQAVEDLEALEETIAVLSDGDTVRQLVDPDTELARGEGETEEQLAEAMRHRGLSV